MDLLGCSCRGLRAGLVRIVLVVLEKELEVGHLGYL